MTPLAWFFVTAAAAFAEADWWAVWTERLKLRKFTKPLSMALLIGAAIALDPFDSAIRTVMVVGLLLSLAGDIFLLSEKRFIAGLVAFLLGHMAYVVALQMAPQSFVGIGIGLAVIAAAIGTIGRRLVREMGKGEHKAMVGPVMAYLVVISAMVVSAWGTLSPAAIVGAMLFYVSDAVLAWNRFLEKTRTGPVAVMVTYHLGQAGLVGWLAWG